MAGLYVHIPFCKRRCLYCDFFSTTLLERREEYVQAVLQEISNRREEAGEPIRTIYIGGGTPSMLTAEQIRTILATIGTKDATEITMEANPGDLTSEYLRAIRRAGINRLSIGIQSFKDELLQLIGRRHTATQAINAVHMAQEAGFDNISIDLMYALPTQTMTLWEEDIESALRMNIQHISCYGLMYEDGTALSHMRDTGDIEPIDEDTENEMYDVLCCRLKQAGFTHYEVSNFALPGYESKHNSSYWNGTPYVGIGAGAHSYVGRTRNWNPNDIDAYINGIKQSNLVRESEQLTDTDLYNERIMLGLRTCRGIYVDKTPIKPRQNPDPLTSGLRDDNGTIARLCEEGLLRMTEDCRIVATQKGLHVLNRIITELMIE